MRELIGIREILREVYDNVLNGNAIIPTYNSKHKYGSLPQSKVFEENEACLKIAYLPKMSLRTKNIAIPYHFFRLKVHILEIKVEDVDTVE